MNRLLLLLAATALAAIAGAADAPKPDFSGVWLPVSRESGRWPAQPPFTPAMIAAREAWNKAVAPVDITRGDDEYISCMPYALPQMVLAITQYPFEIFQTTAQILIHAEVYGQIRRIHMDDTPPPVDRLPTHTGHSRGRWEGNQLVVETSHILPMHEGSRYPGTAAMRVVERFSLQGSGQNRQLIDEVTITDPLVYTQPIKVRMVYRTVADVEVGEYICQQDVWDQHRDGNASRIPWR
jgi:hypothetical protein